jgi:transcription antitermination factor NusB
LALQYLFMADLNGFSGVEAPEDFFRGQRLAEREESGGGDGDGEPAGGKPSRRSEAEDFALLLIREAEGNLAAIDQEIAASADNWSVDRIGAIERNVIRLVAAELRLGASPRRVALDEAVELAKRFGDANSGAFVNGVADRLFSGV